MCIQKERPISRRGDLLFVNLQGGQINRLLDLMRGPDRGLAHGLSWGVERDRGPKSGIKLIVLYFGSPVPNGARREVATLRAQSPHVPIAVLTDSQDLLLYRACRDSGANGVLHTGMDAETARQALRLIVGRDVFSAPAAAQIEH